ncbi:cupin [Pseudonocardia sp. CNS-004]|nr:cupin [Pseudonocardia sp. CNS-004]
MYANQPVRRVTPTERTEGDQTPGMTREQAIGVEGMWAGLVRTEPQMISGWHHHGDYDTSIYIVSGSLRMESGPGGSEVVDAGPGDFVHVPKGAVHREGNPGSEESHIVVVRAGRGPAVINVDGPAAG